MEGQRGKWSSRGTFILAAVGSAVGLGNAWRFPGLMAVHGGGAFLVVYLFAMLIMGIPLLMMEISIGRRMRRGAVGALGGINKKLEYVGWAATTNAFFIVTYYAVVFGWVLLMVVLSVKFTGMVGDTTAASGLFLESIKTTGTVSGWSTIPVIVVLAVLVAWLLIYYCIRDGASSVGKVVKYTVFIPVILLVIMAIKGLTMPNAAASMAKLFIPELSAFADPTLWIDAIGQVFYSLSIMMAIMFAYGSYLGDDADIAVDGMIIAFSDMAVSVLASIVMFTTMGGVGMLDDMSTSGIATAFVIYPQAIVSLTSNGVVNAIFGIIFYLCLVTLAIDSAFSLVEGASASISDKFKLNPKKTTLILCVVAGVVSLLYVSGAGLAVLDIVDHWSNNINMIIIGVMECIAVGWCFKTSKVLDEVNKNGKKFRMPAWWFSVSIKYVSPALLSILFIWNIIALVQSGGIYGSADGYTLWSNIVFGWIMTAIVFGSGFIAKAIFKKKGLEEDNTTWDDMER